MRKRILCIIILLFCANLAFSFDISAYNPVTIDMVDIWIRYYMQENNPGGLGIFNEPISIRMNVDGFPALLSPSWDRLPIRIFSNAMGFSSQYEDDFFTNTFGYFVTFQYNNINYILLFQNELAVSYITNFNINDGVTLYALFGLFVESNREAYIFVNAWSR